MGTPDVVLEFMALLHPLKPGKLFRCQRGDSKAQPHSRPCAIMVSPIGCRAFIAFVMVAEPILISVIVVIGVGQLKFGP